MENNQLFKVILCNIILIVFYVFNISSQQVIKNLGLDKGMSICFKYWLMYIALNKNIRNIAKYDLSLLAIINVMNVILILVIK